MTRCARRPTQMLGRLLIVSGLAAVLSGTALASRVAAPIGPRAAPRGSGVAVVVTRQAITRPLPTGYLGLALEYSTIPEWSAQAGQSANLPLRGLLHGIDPVGHPMIRVGGQSTDRSWWPVSGMKQPLGVTYSLTPAWTDAAQALAKATGARYMLGVNLEANSAAIERTEADNLVDRIGRSSIAALQIGNEPNLYTFSPWYRTRDGHPLPWYSPTGAPVYDVPSDWGPATYENEFAAVEPRLPNLPVAGPDTSDLPWLGGFASRFLSRHSRVQTLTSHAYGLNNCVRDPASPVYPSVDNMLSLTASRDLLNGMGADLAAAHRAGAGFRIDEMGSVTCNGHRGVSDSFASALWVMDALFALARDGVDGVNLHSFPGSDNGLFDFTYESSTHRWRATVHPLYDGVLMFAQADPIGARLLHTSTAAKGSLRAWSTIGADHRVRVLLINDSTTQANDVNVHAPAGDGTAPATLETLRAPGAGARSGILIGGHRFGSTLTGTAPAPALDDLRPDNGIFHLTVPAASATLLTLVPGSGGH